MSISTLDGPDGEARVVCAACGTIHDEATAMLEQLREDVAHLERELRGKRAALSRAQSDQLKSLAASPHYNAAIRVLAFWKVTLMPGAKEIASKKRLAPVIARMEGGYDEHGLNLCAMGYAQFPYVAVQGGRARSGSADRKFVDADLVFRDAKHVDQGLRLWQRHLDEVGPA